MTRASGVAKGHAHPRPPPEFILEPSPRADLHQVRRLLRSRRNHRGNAPRPSSWWLACWSRPGARIRFLPGSPSRITPSAIHFAQHNIHAAENDHCVRHELPEAEVFENRQVDEARRAPAGVIRMRPAVADQVKAEFTLGRFNAAVRLARLWPEAA